MRGEFCAKELASPAMPSTITTGAMSMRRIEIDYPEELHHVGGVLQRPAARIVEEPFESGSKLDGAADDEEASDDDEADDRGKGGQLFGERNAALLDSIADLLLGRFLCLACLVLVVAA